MSLKKNFFYSSVLTTANYVFPLLTYPYVARVLGVTNIGICNFVDSVVNYFILFSMMGIGTIGIREVAKYKKQKEKLREAFSNLFVLNLIFTTVALVTLLVAIYVVPTLSEHKELMYIGALKLVFNFLLIEWFYKGIEDFRYITFRSLVIRCIYVVSVFLFVRDASDYNIYYLLMVLMTVVTAVINMTHSRKYVGFQFKNLSLTRYTKSFLVLGVYMFLTSMYTSFNVAYLGFVSGSTQVGYYTTAVKFHGIILALFSAFTGVMLPRMSSLLSHGCENEFKQYMDKSISILLSFSIPVVIFATILAPEIIYVFSGAGYEGAITPMRIVMPLVFVIGYEQILIVQVLTPLKKDKQILTNSIVGAVVGISLNLLLVKQFQSIGTSMVWLFSELSVLSIAQYFVFKSMRIYVPMATFAKNVVAYLPMGVILYFVHMIDSSVWIKIITGGLFFVLYFLIVQIGWLKNQLIINYLSRFLPINKME